MYVVNTTIAENGRRLVKLREFFGRVLAHGVAIDPPDMTPQSMERMLKEKDYFVASRGGTVKTEPNSTTTDLQINDDADDEASDKEDNAATS